MVDEDLELEQDLGEATIVYDHPEEDITEKTVPNEHIAYFQDHWIIKIDEDDQGRDLIRRIPSRRVHYVERSVEEFEEEIKTLRDQVESFAASLRTKISGDRERDEEEPYQIDLDRDDELVGDDERQDT